MAKMREKFATQVDSEILGELRKLADDEGRQIQGLVEEALLNLIDEHKGLKPRSHVMSAYQKSHSRFSSLYKNLAK